MYWFRVAVFLYATFFFSLLHAETTVIKSSVANAAGLPVELITYSDYISNTEMVLARTTVAKNGTFDLRFELDHTIFSILKIGIQKCEILLEPAKTYQLKISGILSEKLRDKDIPAFQIPWLQVEVINPWKFELNGLTNEFFDFHDEFLAENTMTILRSRNTGVLNKYVTELYNRFPGIDNAWFNDLLTYKTAEIEMMLRITDRKALAEKYLLDHEILYDHMEYMDFFQKFFEKYLITSSLYERRDIVAALDSPQSYSLMMEMLSIDTILKNKRLRELVLIRSMFDLWAIPGFNRDRINKLLQQVQTESKYAEHQLIATNIINHFSAQ